MEAASLELVDLTGSDRERAIPVLKDSFTGIYRWHAKRTLGRIETVRAAIAGGQVVGFALLERLVPEVGYVYYIAVGRTARRQGVGARLLDDALARFRAAGAQVVYAAAEEDNVASIRLFTSRGFRRVERQERGYRDGGLGAWGLRSRMMLVAGEQLLGLRLAPPAPPEPAPDPTTR